MQSRRAGLVAGVALLVFVAVLGPAAAAPQPAPTGPNPGPGQTIFLPIIATAGPQVRFWAEQYALPQGGCTTLHWKVQNAQSVFLNGEGVANVGTREVCPSASAEYYILDVTDSAGNVTSFEVDLTTGDPGLEASEVIAQATVASVTSAADVDPFEAGPQPGFTLDLDEIKPLFVGTAGWNEPAVSLGVPQSLIELGPNGPRGLAYQARPVGRVPGRV